MPPFAVYGDVAKPLEIVEEVRHLARQDVGGAEGAERVVEARAGGRQEPVVRRRVLARFPELAQLDEGCRGAGPVRNAKLLDAASMARS